MIKMLGLTTMKPIKEGAVKEHYLAAMDDLGRAAILLAKCIDALISARDGFNPFHNDGLRVELNQLITDLAKSQGKCESILSKAEKITS